MSLTVEQLNADSCFLLTFKPSFAPRDFRGAFPGSFTILIDPWLSGSSTMFHPKFATTQHTAPSTIRSLQELKDDVGLILISQEKADHCHEETLRTLPKDTKTKILAVSKAAKKILSWKHFDNPDIVEELRTYNSSRPETIARIRIDAYSSASAEGEITIANIASKADLTRVHNAVAITYCPPGTLMTSPEGSTVKLDELPVMYRPGTGQPPPPQLRKRPSIGSPNGVFKAISHTNLRSPTSPQSLSSQISDSERMRRPSSSGSKNTSTLSRRQPNYEKVVSVLYTPHGIQPTVLRPYINKHLLFLPNALPITAMFHALNSEYNPKILGGTVVTGAPGGIELVKEVDVKYWISAHDEVKENTGLATKFLSSTQYQVEEVIKMLRQVDGILGEKGKKTIVEVLGSGGIRSLR